MPKISVIITNFNYGRYLGEAIRSVLDQEYRDFELIVVDDGSTDGSREEIGKFQDPHLKAIFKANGGQLSAFNAGVLESTGDIICFLDADDCYQPGYLQAVSETFEHYPECGFLLTQMEYFGNRTGKALHYPGGYLGCNPFSAAARHVWVGAATSSCSLRRETAEKFLPYREDEDFWKTRADDLLILGSDIVAAVKYVLDRPLVKYRVHGDNLFYGRNTPGGASYQARKAAAERFCAEVMKRNGLRFQDLLRQENENGNLLFRERFFSWLKIGRDRMVSLSEWLRCGGILLRGIRYPFKPVLRTNRKMGKA